MDLRQLEYLVAVVDAGGFTRAARRVGISQSGVSAQIRRLEQELGVELVDRSTRTVRPTPAGEDVLKHARAALAAAAAVREAADQAAGLLRGRLTVGMVTGCTIAPFFDGLARFHAAHPGIELAVTEGASADLMASVRAGDLDLALVGVAGAPPEGLSSFTVARESLAAMVSPTHPLADGDRVPLAELSAHPVVCMPPGTGIRAVLDRSFAAARLSPSIAFEASAADAIADLAGRGVGVGVVSASMARGYEDRLHVLAIDGITIPAVLAVVWRPTGRRAVAELVRHARAAFDDAAPGREPAGTPAAGAGR